MADISMVLSEGHLETEISITSGESKAIFDDDSRSSLLQRKQAGKRVITRNAMGEYIPDSGGGPLTQLAIPLPGPADYSPGINLTKPASAQCSIVGKPKPLFINDFPGPNKYNTGEDMVWKYKGFPCIGKGRGSQQQTCSLGPAAYNIQHGNFGTGDSQIAMGSRPVLIHGPPNSLVQPVDTVGFKTPGPAEYRPSSAHWGNNVEISFGLALPKKTKEAPGPAEYDIREDDSKLKGPAYSLAKRLPLVTGMQNENPGPGAYDVGTTIGDAVAKSITSRQPEITNLWAPSPNTYNIPSCLGDGAKTSMKYRAFEKRVDPHPSPAEYRLNKNNLNKSAVYSCRQSCRPVYPDILNYPKYGLMKNTAVGPGKYNHKQNFSDNDSPSYSIGKTIQPKCNETPGPASYSIRKPTRPDAKRAPAFSMGVRIEWKKETVGPGPAAYHPNNDSAPKHSMSGRHKRQQSVTTPAPNAYRVKSGQTNHGRFRGPQASLKGRPSPFMYSGFRNIAAS